MYTQVRASVDAAYVYLHLLWSLLFFAARALRYPKIGGHLKIPVSAFLSFNNTQIYLCHLGSRYSSS